MNSVGDKGITAMWGVNGDIAEMTLKGELDAHSSPMLDPLFIDLVTAGARSLVIDMSQVDFVDSSGLRTLIRARQQFGGDRPIAIRAPQPTTARLLEITGLTDQFPIEA